MASRKSARRPWLWAVLAGLLPLAVAAGALILPRGQAWLLERVLAALVGPEVTVTVGRAQGLASGRTRVRHLALARAGMLVEMDELVVTWRPGALFERHLAITALAATGVRITPAAGAGSPEPARSAAGTDFAAAVAPLLDAVAVLRALGRGAPLAITVERFSLAGRLSAAGREEAFLAHGSLLWPRDGAPRLTSTLARAEGGPLLALEAKEADGRWRLAVSLPEPAAVLPALPPPLKPLLAGPATLALDARLIRASVTLADIRLDWGAVRLRGRGEIGEETAAVDLEVAPESVSAAADLLSLGVEAPGPLKLALAWRQGAAPRLTAGLETAAARAGDLALTGATLSARWDGREPALLALTLAGGALAVADTPLGPVRLSGRIMARGDELVLDDGRLALADGRFALAGRWRHGTAERPDLELSFAGDLPRLPAALAAALPSALDGPLALSGRLLARAQGVRITELTLAAPDRITARGNLDVADGNPRFAGDIEIAHELLTALAGPDAVARLVGDDGLRFSGALSRQGGAWVLDGRLAGIALDPGPLALAGTLARDGQMDVRLAPARGSWRLHLRRGPVADGGGAIAARLILAGPGPAPAGWRIDGAGSAELDWSAGAGFAVRLAFSRLAIGHGADAPWEMAELFGELRGSGLADLAGRIALARLRGGGLHLEETALTLAPGPAGARIAARGRLLAGPAGPLAVTLAARRQDGVLTLEEAALAAGDETLLRLVEPVRLPLATLAEAAARSRWRLAVAGGGELAIAPAAEGTAGWSLALSGTALRPLTAPFGRGIDGRIAGGARVRIEDGRLIGTAALTLADALPAPLPGDAPGNAAALFSFGGTVTVRAKPDMLVLELALASGAGARLAASVRAGRGPGALAVDPHAPLAGRITVDAPLAPFWRLLAFDLQELDGDLSGEVTVSGNPAAPALSGRLTLTHGRYRHLLAGLVLEDAAAEAVLDGRVLRIVKAGAVDGAGGRLAVTGVIPLEGEAGMALSLKAESLHLLRTDALSLVADADLALRGALTEMTLSGALEAREAEVRILALPQEIRDLPVTEIGVPAGASASSAPAAAAPATAAPAMRPVVLDVAARIPRRLFVRGRGLDSEWRGDIRITGTSAEPRLSGALDLARGSFTFAGRRFVLQEGRVLFAGGGPQDARISVTGRFEATGFAAIAELAGTPRALNLSLRSEPELPEDEILSRVLFGRGVASLSALESVELARSLAALRGGERLPDVIGFARRSLGLDVLQLGAGGADEAGRLVAGKYLAGRFYVEVEVVRREDGEDLALRIALRPGLQIESRIDQDTGPSLGVRWRWRY